MNGIWDVKADVMTKGDVKRDVSPIKTYKDENGYTHYVFTRVLFNNPYYKIPKDDHELFKKYVEGGSRAYPSDGAIPCDVVAGEARKVMKKIIACSENPTDVMCNSAIEALKHGKNSLVRGTLKLYLGKYTTRDWRRKRFTDDIDFWTFQINVLEHSLRECSFNRNKKTGEFEKHVHWTNPNTRELKQELLFAANNLNQLLDFGAGSFLEGSALKNIFNKKIKRGHDVDLSDILNVAMINDGETGSHKDEWNEAWSTFEEVANRRDTRSTSNLLSLARYALGIADYSERVGKAIDKYNDEIFDKSKYSDADIKRIAEISIHWVKYLEEKGIDATRELLHSFYHEQAEEKPIHATNLRILADKILILLNSKYEYQSARFEIE